MHTARLGLTTRTVDEIIYAIAGAAGYDALPMIEVCYPNINTWISKALMPTPRVASASIVNGKIFYIGRALTIKPPNPAVSTVEEYIPSR